LFNVRPSGNNSPPDIVFGVRFWTPNLAWIPGSEQQGSGLHEASTTVKNKLATLPLTPEESPINFNFMKNRISRY